MKTVKIEVIDGSIHTGDKIHIKGDIFEIDEKFAKSLIESNVAKEVAAETKTKNTANADAGKKDKQDDVFGKINNDLDGKDKDKK